MPCFKLKVYSIYDWFEVDFGDTEQGVIEHLKQYANADLKAALQQIDEIDNDSYDWSLNSVDKPTPRASQSRGGS